MIHKQKNKLCPVVSATCEILVAGSLAVLTTLGLIGLVGCNLNDSFSSTGSEEAVVSTRVDSNHISAGLNANMEKQPKRIVVTGEMGIIMPRTGQPYGTIDDRKSGELYNIYGNDIDLHKKLMEKLHKMFDAKKWPVDIKASGFLKAPGFIPGDLKNSISITDLDQVVQWPK
jgi:hypothetical protein